MLAAWTRAVTQEISPLHTLEIPARDKVCYQLITRAMH